MSGGSLGCIGDTICNRVFDYSVNVHYRNLNNPGQCQKVRDMNPMEDREVSELLYDMACLLHSCEWYKSGDICEESYKEHLQKFKQKWLKRTSGDRLKAYKADLKSCCDALIAEMDGDTE